MTKREFEKLLESSDFAWFIGMSNPPRPGIRLCLTKLEYMYYPPNTPRNSSFVIGIVEFGEIEWVVAGIPIKEKKYMDDVLSGIDLEITPDIPYIISSAGIEGFPIKGENVYMIRSAKTHPIFRCETQEEIFRLFREENKEIERITKRLLH